MAAFALLGFLLGGIAIYVALATYQLRTWGVPAWLWVLAAPFVYWAVIGIIPAVRLLISNVFKGRHDGSQRLSFASLLRLYLREVSAIAADVLAMALHRLVIWDPAPRKSERPVLLLHGVLCNDGVWLSTLRALKRSGIGPVYTLSYGPPLAAIDRFAEQLKRRIDEICKLTGAQQVTLVGHSMGGLVARAYLQRYGSERVRKLITLGTPHHGSNLARFVAGQCVAQMRPSSTWLASLNDPTAGQAFVPITSIWSRHDTMVLPPESSRLQGATNIELEGVDHVALLADSHVHALLAREINTA